MLGIGNAELKHLTLILLIKNIRFLEDAINKKRMFIKTGITDYSSLSVLVASIAVSSLTNNFSNIGSVTNTISPLLLILKR